GCTVLPWQLGSRLLRGGAIACFLAAFHLPAGVAAVLLVMLAQTGGRLLPLAPFSAAAAVGVLTAGFGPATGATVTGGQVAAFMIGMSTVLTIAGALPDATAHADWIVNVEQATSTHVEAGVQHALTGTFVLWILNNLYLAAQLVVLPGALWLLYKKSRPAYERLRNTILATWLISIPVYALFP